MFLLSSEADVEFSMVNGLETDEKEPSTLLIMEMPARTCLLFRLNYGCWLWPANNECSRLEVRAQFGVLPLLTCADELHSG